MYCRTCGCAQSRTPKYAPIAQSSFSSPNSHLHRQKWVANMLRNTLSSVQFCVGHVCFDGEYTTQYCVEFAVACRSHTTSMLPHTILTLLVLLVSSPSKYNSMLPYTILALRVLLVSTLQHNFMDVRKVCFEK